MTKFNLDKLRKIAKPNKYRKHTGKEREEALKKLEEHFEKKKGDEK